MAMITELIEHIKEINELIDEVEEDKQRLLAKAEKCTASFSDEEKVISVQNATEINFQNYTQKCIEQDKLTAELVQIKHNLEIQIQQIKNTRYRRILKYHYIDGYSIKQTARKFNYSYSYLRNKLLPKIIKESA